VEDYVKLEARGGWEIQNRNPKRLPVLICYLLDLVLGHQPGKSLLEAREESSPVEDNLGFSTG
jgi:hypothetical protein